MCKKHNDGCVDIRSDYDHGYDDGFTFGLKLALAIAAVVVATTGFILFFVCIK